MPDFRRTLERAFRWRVVVKDTADAVVATGESAQPREEADGSAGAPSLLATIAVTLAGIAAFLNLYATQPLLPMLARVFGVSKAAIGTTVSAATIGVALSAPFCGAFAERIGRRRVIVTATFVLAIPTLLAATAQSLTALVVWRFLQGVVMPGIFGVTIAYIAEEWPAWRVARTMSFYVSGTVFGGFLGRVIHGYAATHRLFGRFEPSWRTGFVIVAALDLLFCAAIARWLPADRKTAAAARAGGGMLRHLANPRLLATFAVGFNVLFSLVAIFTYITFHLAAPPYSLTPAQLSTLFVVYLAGLVVTPLAGIGIARAGSRAALIVAVGASMAGVAMTLLHPLPLILAGLVLCSSGVFVCQSASTSYIQVAAPPGGRSSAAGLYVSCYYSGGSAAGVLPGLFWSLGGWRACVTLVLAVQAITIAIASVWWKDS